MRNLSEYDFLAGEMLFIDKPQEWTSFDVVNKVRWLIRRSLGIKKIKVGHAGTLDPMATGLLVLCTGKFTKKLTDFSGLRKEYTGTIKLGASTPTYDAESEPDHEFSLDGITEERIKEAVEKFRGEIDQVPPAFSAKRINGKKAYELARRGKEVVMKAAKVTIHEFEITGITLPEVHFRIKCSKGTYIRSIAHDLGKSLNNGGHLTALRRTEIGEFSLDTAKTVVQFEAEMKAVFPHLEKD